MRKNLFLTFCFACCPGAGQMYLGYTKRGASLMLAFFAILGISGFLDLWIFAVVLPVVWFYAFFDTFSIRNASPEQLAAKPDEFLYNIPNPDQRSSAKDFTRKYHIAIGAVLIFVGAYALYNTFLMPLIGQLFNILPYDLWWLWSICRSLPTLCVAGLLVLVGVRMVRGEKNATPTDDVVEFKGEQQDE